MSKDRIRRTGLSVEPTSPSIEQGARASAMLADYYGASGQFGQVYERPDQTEPLSESEVAGRMETLAIGITEGKVRSHRDIALVVQEIGSAIGPFGPTSPEVGDAAYRLAKAVYAHQRSFTPEPPRNTGN